ncbi:MAG: putative selenate reductase subunit YgfK [Faecalibacterium sp.]
MSDIMRPMPFAKLMDWALTEYRNEGSIFGVHKLVHHTDGQALPIFDEKIESPYGPAAGPNTQLAQNIVASYVAGARFFELKTVQIMDGEELSKCVNKPCITAGDECYNCEWSTELTVPQAFDEYVKAWFACKVLARELGLGEPDGFVFNMSVGYDLKGIQSPKVDAYIEGMKDASATPVYQECRTWLLANLDRFQKVDAAFVESIPARVSNSITESTLHGCPPDEIERIATYLITEKHLNTYVKCNPTLLGYDFARRRLDSLGFDYVTFDDHHFVEDLQWADAVPMFRRLTALCQQNGLEFGVKLTNTFPVDVAAGELPSSEMYMSGRALYPLTIALARRVAEEFDGALRISYSGGADAGNIRSLFDAGIWPITMATTVLKPGGYDRFGQIGGLLMDCGCAPFAGVDMAAVQALDEAVAADPRCRKPIKPLPDRKNGRAVPLIDCFEAPCRGGCPIHQDIPGYLRAVQEGRLEDALNIILERNALPFVTGTLCPHHCADKCMRSYYEDAVKIRAAKLTAASGAYEAVLPTLKGAAPRPGKKVAVIGGGPAGLSAASFLSRAGVDVTVFERRETLGGIVRQVIPAFRIDTAAIEKDIALCKAYGAKFVTGTEVHSVAELTAQGFTDVIIAVGAWKPGTAGLKYGSTLDVLEFLEAAKNAPETLSLGRNVVVIGGGNTAMDAARAAKRIPGVEKVRLVYRRTKRYMPADEEELAMALEDGVEFLELLAPVGVQDGKLTCSVMELGAPDISGRRSPVDTGRTAEVDADTVIAAIGETIDTTLYASCEAALDRKGRPAGVQVAPHIYAAGDCRRGPATVVEAIADAAQAAAAIAGADFEKYAAENIDPDEAAVRAKKGTLCTGCEGGCLGCATICETCASVCPNRANVAIRVPGKRQRQILHVDGMCNECGNCAVFCPYDSRPYKDKFTLFWSREDFENSTNAGYLPLDGSRVLVRLGDTVREYDAADPACGLYEDLRQLILTVAKDYAYLLK